MKTNETITLQIPIKDFGAISTLAALANIPLEEYIAKKTMEAATKIKNSK